MTTLLKRYTPLQILIHLGAWFPLARLVFEAFTGGLTANPIQHIEQRTGRAAISLLFLSLAATPLNSLFGWREPLQRRRALGLYAFLYATIHVIIFADLDYGLAWSAIIDTVFQKPYILVGAAAFLLLIPLAVTSFDVWKVRLKKNWKRLHQTVYFIAPLVVLHYAWGKKGNFFALQGDILLPLIYGLIFLLLMLLRIPAMRRFIASARTWLRVRLASNKKPVS
ncbi:MAG TPA: protein-methionine-sulfoxide reductase heme-binding subunit MsrQ [Anaerolineales bacterium]|nr:protein-methionine-sulfoxide reductase heme-binding subunit MsrQ [Anaerolineales bacterium]